MDLLTEARNLAQRYAKGDAFRRYVRERAALVLPTLAIFVAISIALGLGLFGVMGTHHLGVLLAMVLLPFVLFGSFALNFLHVNRCGYHDNPIFGEPEVADKIFFHSL